MLLEEGGRGGRGGGGGYIFVEAKSGENKALLMLKRRDMKAGSMELRLRGSHVQQVDMVCIAMFSFNAL